MAEKYYGINGYGYCAENPIMVVDPDGQNWYSYLDEQGVKRFEYYEGRLTDIVIQRKGYTDLGYSYLDQSTGVYYSLFGKILNTRNENGQRMIEGELYKQIDDLLISTYSEGKLIEKGDFYFGISPGDYHFTYGGEQFLSDKEGTVFHVLNNAENSRLHIEKTPQNYPTIRTGFFGKKYQGFFLVISNDKGYDVIQISFDKENVKKYHSAVKALFLPKR